jgi:TetR/AcrR family transcriptional repressor of nem operon
MSAQFDDLPDVVKTEVQAFTDVNVAWLKKTLVAAKVASPKEAEKRARAIYSAIVGAQLMARSRADIALYDSLIEGYRTAGCFPTEGGFVTDKWDEQVLPRRSRLFP